MDNKEREAKKEQEEKVERMLTNARMHWVHASPFLGSLVMHLKVKLIYDEPTGATDGRHLFANPEWVSQLEPGEVRFFVAHELMHCAMDHISRLKDRNPTRWNVAIDYVVNDAIRAAWPELPADLGLYNADFSGLSADEVYDLLPDSCGHTQFRPGQKGTIIVSPDERAGETSAESSLRWRRAVRDAVARQEEADRARGSGPGGALKDLAVAGEPQTPWTQRLASVMTSGKGWPRWSKPNRRYAARGLILPSHQKMATQCVVVAIDTSGSVSEEDYKLFSAELFGLLNMGKPVTTHLLACDMEVCKHTVVRDIDLPIVNLPEMSRTYGGTDFRPAFKWVEEQELSPDLFIYLTDLEGPMPNKEPPYPVLWIAVGKSSGPDWGEVVRLVA